VPRVSSSGIDLHVIERGSGDETVVFAHSFLADHRHFEPQIEALAGRYRVIAYDHRDHGRSGKASRRYGIYDLVADGVSVIDQTGVAPCHWIGLSTGGFVGMRIALERPELLRSLVLMDTAGGSEPWTRRLRYNAMLAVLRVLGVKPLIGEAMRAMFAASSFDDPELAGVLDEWRERMLANDPRGLIRFGKAIWSRDDVLDRLRELDLPTLVVVGDQDAALAPEISRRLADAIAGARLEIIERAGHLCTVERPERVSEVLAEFLGSV
jgi:pimeloyl-ACP methyl ester carboxylesterase